MHPIMFVVDRKWIFDALLTEALSTADVFREPVANKSGQWQM